MTPKELESIINDDGYSSFIKTWLSTRTPQVIKNITLVQRSDLLTGKSFHISKDGDIKKFIPRIGDRQGKTEDRTTPRVCVSNTILDCINGYCSTSYDFIDLEVAKNNNSIGYLGGYYIYAFDTDYLVKPNTKLVYDTKLTDEYWLVTYSPETVEYKAKRIGKVWMKSLNFVNGTGHKREVIGTWYLETTEPISLTDKVGVIEPGYYSWVSAGTVKGDGCYFDPPKGEFLKPVTKQEYLDAKKVYVDLLCFQGW